MGRTRGLAPATAQPPEPSAALKDLREQRAREAALRAELAKLKLKDFHGALRDARTAKVIDCDYVKAWFREGSALTELGDYENAALCFFEGMQVEGQSENPDLKRGFDDAIKKGRDALGKK